MARESADEDGIGHDKPIGSSENRFEPSKRERRRNSFRQVRRLIETLTPKVLACLATAFQDRK